MIDLSAATPLDKTALIGACARLPLGIDAARLRAEVDALPETMWETRGGRLGPHDAARAIFLRGYAPAEGRHKPVEDREALACVPYAREIITQRLGSDPQRCLLARLPGGAVVPPHSDNGPYFQKTIRIHVPVITHEKVWMYCDGRVYNMRPGEVWALNNSAEHAVWNADATLSRTHLICDFLPAPDLLDLLARAERGLGAVNAAVETYLQAAPIAD
ncbi:MAG: aspartyl/asparaginyl beta-hydroxylase domain-containing protein [Xanthomonadales bacterium PRO7]|nr:aspartyl/asparaginyl beta-hydroxylase domain-containing protein [Xanthomonadales bacterium PRO7]